MPKKKDFEGVSLQEMNEEQLLNIDMQLMSLFTSGLLLWRPGQPRAYKHSIEEFTARLNFISLQIAALMVNAQHVELGDGLASVRERLKHMIDLIQEPAKIVPPHLGH